MSRRISFTLPFVLLVTLVSSLFAEGPIDVGSTRQLFVDRHLIAKRDGVDLELHPPVRRETAIGIDFPWERYGVSYMVTFKDGDRFRAWYRCDPVPLDDPQRKIVTAYAESSDGIHWHKPMLGIVELGGSKENNIVWAGQEVNLAPFKDLNPAAPPEERYKAIGRDRGLVSALVSPDGLHWRRMQREPIFTDKPFDSHNVAFWDNHAQQYVAYTRGIRTEGQLGRAMVSNFRSGVRWIRRATSKDFRHWTPLELIDTGDAPREQFYTNAAVAYPRSPGLYLMFPSRFANAREPTPGWPHGKGVNDIVLLTSRDGLHFDRTFMEAFVRPGTDPGNWHERALYMERGILQTSEQVLSLYGMENWRLETNHIRRFTIRTDGFVSIRAPYEGGSFVTRPLIFAGNTLRLNYSASAVGSVQVEVQDAEGKPIPGFALSDCPEVLGDKIDGVVTWQSGAELGKLAGTPVRLRFVMYDADLYALRFDE